MVKNLPANAGDARDLGSIPGLGRSPRVGNGYPFRYSCLENHVDRRAWWATVHAHQHDCPEKGGTAGIPLLLLWPVNILVIQQHLHALCSSQGRRRRRTTQTLAGPSGDPVWSQHFPPCETSGLLTPLITFCPQRWSDASAKTTSVFTSPIQPPLPEASGKTAFPSLPCSWAEAV